MNHEKYSFYRAAFAGKVPDKDAVARAVQQLPQLYQKQGVPKKEAHAKAAQIYYQFQHADPATQIRIGRSILYAYHGLLHSVNIKSRP